MPALCPPQLFSRISPRQQLLALKFSLTVFDVATTTTTTKKRLHNNLAYTCKYKQLLYMIFNAPQFYPRTMACVTFTKKEREGGKYFLVLALVNNKPGCYYNQITTVYKTINILKCAFFLYIRPEVGRVPRFFLLAHAHKLFYFIGACAGCIAFSLAHAQFDACTACQYDGSLFLFFAALLPFATKNHKILCTNN